MTIAAGAGDDYTLRPIGHIRSPLRATGEAPGQGSDGAPDAWLGLDPIFVRGLFSYR